MLLLVVAAILFLLGAPTAWASTVDDLILCGDMACEGDGETLGAGGQVPGSGKPVDQPNGGGSVSLPDTYSYTERMDVPACSSNGPYNVDWVLCTNAISCPVMTETRYWIFVRTINVDARRTPRESAGPWVRRPGSPCLSSEDTNEPSLGEIVTTVRADFVRKRPALPTVVIKPAPQVLVTARNSFSAGSDQPVELTDTILGLPIVITATPRRWIWNFGDGETLTTTTPGSPGSLEVSHAYQRVGDLTVGVTVEWSGTFRVGGFTGEFPIDGVARVQSGPIVLQSREARTELVDR